MGKSKLEKYEDIMAMLARQPLNIDTIAYRLSTSCTIIQQRLNFLLDCGLIAERCLNGRKLFVITERGRAVLRALKLQRRLEKITDALRLINNP